MRRFLLVVAAVTGSFTILWLAGATNFGADYPDYLEVARMGREPVPPGPGPFRALSENVPRVYAEVAFLACAVTLLLAEGIGPRPKLMVVRGWRGRVKRWVRNRRRPQKRFDASIVQGILVDTAGFKEESTGGSYLFLAYPIRPKGIQRHPLE